MDGAKGKGIIDNNKIVDRRNGVVDHLRHRHQMDPVATIIKDPMVGPVRVVAREVRDPMVPNHHHHPCPTHASVMSRKDRLVAVEN